MSQPNWKYIANLGDVNPLDYGGFFIYEDTTKVYAAEGEYYIPEENQCYRFSLDKMSFVNGHLISADMLERSKTKSLPYPIESYTEWYEDSLSSIASYIGVELSELQTWFTSDNVLDRARAYESLGQYHGFENLDSYPLHLTKTEAKKRYAKELKRRD